jgi:Fe-Mn family superoxide dismutase
MSKYTLPDLRYDYGALEPHISGEIMTLHHDKHHRAYVDGANRAIEQLEEVRARHDYARLGPLEKALAFNLSGHVLHSLFWQNLSPDGGGEPEGELADAITEHFGGFGALRKQLIQTATGVMGSGWGVLAWDPVGRRLVTLQIHDHQSEIVQAAVPLLVLDVWEHAYYLQYKNDRASFCESIWSLWNWPDVEARFERAARIDLGLGEASELEAGVPAPM